MRLTNDAKKNARSQADFCARSCDPLLQQMAEHVRALDSQLTDAENLIDDFAWRGEDWSYPCMLAHIADYHGITVKQLEERMDAARGVTE